MLKKLYIYCMYIMIYVYSTKSFCNLILNYGKWCNKWNLLFLMESRSSALNKTFLSFTKPQDPKYSIGLWFSHITK